MAIEAVLLDFGGVFTTSPFDAFNRYENERGLPNDIFFKVGLITVLDAARVRSRWRSR